MKYPKVNGIYKHYKGGLYEVITLATCTDRKIPVVVYRSTLFGTVYTRDLNEWFQSVNREELYDDTGKQYEDEMTYRFVEVEPLYNF